MSARCTYNSIMTARETLDANVAGAANPEITHSAFNTDLTLNATSTPPVSQVVYLELDLTAGAYTIDLTSLQGVDGVIDGTGLKVQAIKFQNIAGNAALSFKAGASNGYNLGGNANWEVHLGAAADESQHLYRDTNPDISGTAKTIDVAGTGTQSFKVAIWLG